MHAEARRAAIAIGIRRISSLHQSVAVRIERATATETGRPAALFQRDNEPLASRAQAEAQDSVTCDDDLE
jgi:hypothetical protein